MKKQGSINLDIFCLLTALEALAALILLLSIPGDPKNNLIFGLSLQRLALAIVMVFAMMIFSAGFVFSRRHSSAFSGRVEKIFSARKAMAFLHALCTVLAAAGAPVIMWLASSHSLESAVFLRMMPLLAWMGLVGLQGIVFLFWRDHKPDGYGLANGIKWVFTTLIAAAQAAFMAWFVYDPAASGMFLDSDLAIAGFFILVIFSMLFARRSVVFWWMGLAAALAVFILPLMGIWTSGVSDLNFLTGLFPFNDAHGYYLGARHLADGTAMNSFAAHRPLFPAFLGFLLGISAQNLQIAILLLVGLGAAAAFFLADGIRRTHGAVTAGLVFLLVFFFFRRFIGSTMTETQGLAMGAAGFAVLWRSMAQKKLAFFAIGLACLSIALNARAGPFFILPALVLWAAWFFRERGWFSWKVVVIGVLAAAVGFGANAAIFRATANEESAAFSNFSYTLYGTAVGGKGWKQIFVDHPELYNLNEPDLSRQIYQYAFDEVRKNPAGLVQGSLLAWKSLFSLDFYGMFGFVQGADKELVKAVRIALYLLSLCGLIGLLARWKQRESTFLLAAILGVLLSVPFVPPLDAEIRTYAAVIPLFAILAGLGIWEILRLAGRWLIKPSNPVEGSQSGSTARPASGWAAAGFALGFCLLAVFGPLAVKAIARPPLIHKIACPSGEEAVYIRVNPGAYIQVVADDAAKRTWLPVIRRSDFIRSIHDFPFFEITEELDPVMPPATLSFSYDLTDGRHVWLIADSRIFPQPTGLFAVCGRWTDSMAEYGYGFFYADSIHLDEGGLAGE